jgi:hypothetical protein
MKASKLYQESRERSRWVVTKLFLNGLFWKVVLKIDLLFSKYTMKEQLEMLAERQGKIERRRPP